MTFQMNKILAAYRKGFLFLVLVQLARDVWHIWHTLRKYKKRMRDLRQAGKINAAAQLDNKHCEVTRQNFERSLDAISKSWTSKDGNTPLYKMNSLAYTVTRESFVFLGGGRAALLQLAHPYVSSGLEAHSDIGSGYTVVFFICLLDLIYFIAQSRLFGLTRIMLSM